MNPPKGFTEYRKVTVRIGGGAKLHPAYHLINAQGKGCGLSGACSCPGMANGHAMRKAKIAAQGWESADCRSLPTRNGAA